MNSYVGKFARGAGRLLAGDARQTLDDAKGAAAYVLRSRGGRVVFTAAAVAWMGGCSVYDKMFDPEPAEVVEALTPDVARLRELRDDMNGKITSGKYSGLDLERLESMYRMANNAVEQFEGSGWYNRRSVRNGGTKQNARPESVIQATDGESQPADIPVKD